MGGGALTIKTFTEAGQHYSGMIGTQARIGELRTDLWLFQGTDEVQQLPRETSTTNMLVDYERVRSLR
jgi:hypothetical protein